MRAARYQRRLGGDHQLADPVNNMRSARCWLRRVRGRELLTGMNESFQAGDLNRPLRDRDAALGSRRPDAETRAERLYLAARSFDDKCRPRIPCGPWRYLDVHFALDQLHSAVSDVFDDGAGVEIEHRAIRQHRTAAFAGLGL